MFSVHTTPGKLETFKSPAILDLCLEKKKAQARKSRPWLLSSSSKSSVVKFAFFHTETKRRRFPIPVACSKERARDERDLVKKKWRRRVSAPSPIFFYKIPLVLRTAFSIVPTDWEPGTGYHSWCFRDGLVLTGSLTVEIKPRFQIPLRSVDSAVDTGVKVECTVIAEDSSRHSYRWRQIFARQLNFVLIIFSGDCVHGN